MKNNDNLNRYCKEGRGRSVHKFRYVIGIDEAGRGPLAGPVAVGVVCVTKNFNWQEIPGVNDSKKLSGKNRKVIYSRAKKLKKEGKLDFAVAMVSAGIIDRVGIVAAISHAIKRALNRIERRHNLQVCPPCLREDCEVKLDGGLVAPSNYKKQETIIKGDAKEKIIGLASIMAKVTRDRYMVRKSMKSIFAPYTFATHKGYGTKVHREAIEKYGPSTEHRLTFCKNILL